MCILDNLTEKQKELALLGVSDDTHGEDTLYELKLARDIAMEYSLKARIPECGKFAEIAQILDNYIGDLNEV